MALPDARRSVIGFPQLTETGGVVGGDHPTEWTRHVSSLWQLDGDKIRPLRGDAARAVVKAAGASMSR
jgi:hypothetical protein